MIIRGQGGIEAEILAYTDNPDTGKPIITFRLKFHRYVVEQFLKHRVMSCNANSSRAMSVPKMNQWILDNPANPIFWGAQKKGMQPDTGHNALLSDIDEYSNYIDLNGMTNEEAWEDAKTHVMARALAYWEAGYHQQIPNRLTHCFQMANYIVTATEFDNFFNLRLHDKAAQSEISELARCMKLAIDSYTPQRPIKKNGQHWHLPYILQSEIEALELDDLLILSSARCAIVSYNNHNTENLLSLDSAKKIYNHLINDNNPHLTPMEHQARIETLEESQLREKLTNFIKLQKREDSTTFNEIYDQKLSQLNFYANFDRWVSHRYIKERYN